MNIKEREPVTFPIILPRIKRALQRDYFSCTQDDWEPEGTYPFNSNFHFSIFTCLDHIIIHLKNFSKPWAASDCFLSFQFSLNNPRSIFETNTILFPYLETWPFTLTPYSNLLSSHIAIDEDGVEFSAFHDPPRIGIEHYWPEI